MTDDFQKSQGRLGSSELDKRHEHNLLQLLAWTSSLYLWIGNIGLCMAKAGQAFHIALIALVQMMKSLCIHLYLTFLLSLQKVRISLINPFTKTAQSKGVDLSNNPINEG